MGVEGAWWGELAETRRRTLLQLSPPSSGLSVTWTTHRMENQQRQGACDGETAMPDPPTPVQVSKALVAMDTVSESL